MAARLVRARHGGDPMKKRTTLSLILAVLAGIMAMLAATAAAGRYPFI